MRKLSVFNSISLDGYFTDARGDMSWAHSTDPEFDAWTRDNAKGGGALVFGRVTYDMMAAWWPSPAAAQAMPEVAHAMNNLEKFVFSKSLAEAKWQNTAILRGSPVDEMRTLKDTEGLPLTIMGSGTIVQQLAPTGLIDRYQLVVCPMVLGAGRTLFNGIPDKLGMALTESRQFSNGKVALTYVSKH